jgi:hypothetical protein
MEGQGQAKVCSSTSEPPKEGIDGRYDQGAAQVADERKSSVATMDTFNQSSDSEVANIEVATSRKGSVAPVGEIGQR